MKRIVGEMKASKLYDNSIIIMASDNGGSPIDGGNNYPLRGAKKTLFEGGQHVPAFIHSSKFISNNKATNHPLKGGSSFTGLFHVSDWMPTLLAATSTHVDEEISDKFDGLNQWDNLMNSMTTTSSTTTATSSSSTASDQAETAEMDGDSSSSSSSSSVRDEVLLNIDYISQSDGETVVSSIGDAWMGLISVINGKKYKLLVNQEDYTYYLPYSNNAYGDNGNSKISHFLFDLSEDFKESTNLLEHTEVTMKEHDLMLVVHKMSTRLCHFYNHKMKAVQFKSSSDSSSNAKDIIENMHNNWIT
jgi:hypothetical protein